MSAIKEVIAQELETVDADKNVAVIVIDDCGACPYFDNEYWDYNHICTKLDRYIVSDDHNQPIPDDCPVRVEIE